MSLRSAPVVLIVAVILGHAPASTARQSTREQPLTALAELASGMLMERGYIADIVEQRNTVQIRWKIRDYMVYTKDEGGRWGTELVKVQGPDHEGFWFTIRLADGRFDKTGDPGRIEARPSMYVLGSIQRHPYFKTYPSATTLDRIDQHILVDISVGAGTDPKLIRELHKAMIKRCQELGWAS